MRSSEWIQAGFAILIAVAAWIFPLSWRRRSNILKLALGAVAGVAFSRTSVYFLRPFPASILRDWLPVVLTLIPYWQAGQFFVGPNEKIQAWLVASDQRLFAAFSRTGLRFGHTVRLTMEWAYSLCYPIVPLGLGVLYLAGLRRYADTYWVLVLLPTYLCYVITPLFPALPPRSLGDNPSEPRKTKSRTFNFWIAKHGSIQAISFPSAHVASALGVAFVLLHYLPVAGAVFLAIGLWIAIAAVVGRYHYAIDVVLGGLVSLAVDLVWRY